MQGSRVSAEEDDEAELLLRARAGDETAFATLTARHSDRLRGVAGNLLGARADLDDLFQEARLKALRALKGFRGDAKFGTWFGRIVTNLAISELRRRRTRATVELIETPAGEEPWVHAERMELRERLAAAVDRLPPAMRQVFDLRHRDGLEPTRIAETLGLPAATVRTRLFHARRRLKEALDDLVSG